MEKHYTVFYLVSFGDTLFVNCYKDEEETHGGWASSDGHNASRVPSPGERGGLGRSYQQQHIRSGYIKATRIRVCEANKLLAKWGYDFRFPR